MTTDYRQSAGPAEQPEPIPEGLQAPVEPVGALATLLPQKSFPTPSLIPPAVLRRRAVAKAQRAGAFALLVVLGVFGVLFLLGRMQLAAAQQQLSAAEQQLQVAEAAKAEYSEVPAVYAAVDAARSELAQAMGNEVQVARLVTNLSAIMPPSVSLTTVSMTIGEDETTSSTAATTTDVIEPLVGTVTFSGEARSFNDVSTWIDTLRGQADYQNVILTDVSRDTENGIYIFSNSAELTDQALSGRFVEETQ